MLFHMQFLTTTLPFTIIRLALEGSIVITGRDNGSFSKISLTPASHCKRKQGVSSAEAVRMQSRSSARPLPFHTGSVCSARLNSVFCTEWANSNLILNTIGLDLLLE